MKNIDINEVQKRRYETFEKEKDNLILTKIDGGYSISNLNKGSIYTVTRDSSGSVNCTCKDFTNYAGLIRCKHIISVLKKADRKSKTAIKAEDNNLNMKKEEINMNSNQNNPINNNIIKEEVQMYSNSKFNPQNYLTKVKGKDYLEVKYRIHWFRMDHPDYSIKTEITHLDIEKGIIIVRADVYDSTGKHLATGHKMEYQKNFYDYTEKSETGAIGRALACLGYGTLQTFDLEEGIEKGRIADAPVTPPSVSPKAPSPTYKTTDSKLPIPTAPAQKPTAINPVSKTQSAGYGNKSPGGNGTNKGNQTDIGKIIDRW